MSIVKIIAFAFNFYLENVKWIISLNIWILYIFGSLFFLILRILLYNNIIWNIIYHSCQLSFNISINTNNILYEIFQNYWFIDGCLKISSQSVSFCEISIYIQILYDTLEKVIVCIEITNFDDHIFLLRILSYYPTFFLQ